MCASKVWSRAENGRNMYLWRYRVCSTQWLPSVYNHMHFNLQHTHKTYITDIDTGVECNRLNVWCNEIVFGSMGIGHVRSVYLDRDIAIYLHKICHCINRTETTRTHDSDTLFWSISLATLIHSITDEPIRNTFLLKIVSLHRFEKCFHSETIRLF